MKILIVSQWFVSTDPQRGIYVPGGTERYAYDLAKQLQDDGYKVTVLSTTLDKDKIGWDVLDDVSVYRFKEPNRFYGYFIDLLAFANTFKLIKTFDPQVIHIVSSRYRFAVGAVVASKVMTKKVVYTMTVLPHKEGRGYFPVLIDNFVLTQIVERVDAIISLSREMSDALIKKIHIKKIVTIPNPYTKNCYIKKSAKERKSILFVGRLDIATKGIDHLIKALHYVRMEIPDVKLHVCGRGDDETLNYLFELVSKYNLEENILFHGHLNDNELADRYSSSEVIALPSLSGGATSYVLIEAVSAGLPIIAYDLDCFCEALEDGKYGILVKKGEIKELAEEISKVLKDEEIRNYYSKMSLEMYKKYTGIEIMQKIEKLYFDIATC